MSAHLIGWGYTPGASMRAPSRKIAMSTADIAADITEYTLANKRLPTREYVEGWLQCSRATACRWTRWARDRFGGRFG
jgi:hypothetical protein